MYAKSQRTDDTKKTNKRSTVTARKLRMGHPKTILDQWHGRTLLTIDVIQVRLTVPENAVTHGAEVACLLIQGSVQAHHLQGEEGNQRSDESYRKDASNTPCQGEGR